MFVLRVSWSSLSGLLRLGESRFPGTPAGTRKQRVTVRVFALYRVVREAAAAGSLARRGTARHDPSCVRRPDGRRPVRQILLAGGSEQVDVIAGRVWVLGSQNGMTRRRA
jgi:hypothetical protein